MKSLNRNKAGDNVWNAMKHTTHLGISTKCWNPLECLFIYLMFCKIKKCDKIFFFIFFLNISKKKLWKNLIMLLAIRLSHETIPYLMVYLFDITRGHLFNKITGNHLINIIFFITLQNIFQRILIVLHKKIPYPKKILCSFVVGWNSLWTNLKLRQKHFKVFPCTTHIVHIIFYFTKNPYVKLPRKLWATRAMK